MNINARHMLIPKKDKALQGNKMTIKVQLYPYCQFVGLGCKRWTRVERVGVLKKMVKLLKLNIHVVLINWKIKNWNYSCSAPSCLNSCNCWRWMQRWIHTTTEATKYTDLQTILLAIKVIWIKGNKTNKRFTGASVKKKNRIVDKFSTLPVVIFKPGPPIRGS